MPQKDHTIPPWLPMGALPTWSPSSLPPLPLPGSAKLTPQVQVWARLGVQCQQWITLVDSLHYQGNSIVKQLNSTHISHVRKTGHTKQSTESCSQSYAAGPPLLQPFCHMLQWPYWFQEPHRITVSPCKCPISPLIPCLGGKGCFNTNDISHTHLTPIKTGFLLFLIATQTPILNIIKYIATN